MWLLHKQPTKEATTTNDTTGHLLRPNIPQAVAGIVGLLVSQGLVLSRSLESCLRRINESILKSLARADKWFGVLLL